VSRGVVAGKFHPFHLGHRHLMDTALDQVDHLDVIVCAADGETVPGETRARWIDETYAARPVKTHVFDCTGVSADDSALWAQITLGILALPPTICFTSEQYGDSWAEYLGCRHISVDPTRSSVRISGSEIRADVLSHLDFLPPATRASFCRRVCVLGAESTGKTTLSHDLAGALHTDWVAEYGRTYCEEMADPLAHIWSTEDFARIIAQQHQLEDELASRANRVLICDTDAFTTCVFHDVYLGRPAPADLTAQIRRYDLYLLTDPATPFAQDVTGLRNAEARTRMHQAYETMLAETGARYIELTGTPGERVAAAAQAVTELLSEPLVLQG
jgi:HTH-type transcriptional repressor of NAD biosynthesis genes